MRKANLIIFRKPLLSIRNLNWILAVLFPVFLFIFNIYLVMPKFSVITLQTFWNSYSQVYDSMWVATFRESGQFPVWNHYLVCGVNYMTNFPFPYSLIRLFTLIGFAPTFSLILAEYIFAVMASLFAYLFLKKSGVSPFLSFIGGILTAYVYYRFHTIEAYPLALAAAVLFYCESYRRNPKTGYIVGGILSVGIVSCSGIFHAIFFFAMFHFLYALLLTRCNWKDRYWPVFLFSWGIGLVLAVPTLVSQVLDSVVSDRLVFHSLTQVVKGMWLARLKDLLVNFTNITPANVLYPLTVAGFGLVPFISGNRKIQSLNISNLVLWVVCAVVYTFQDGLRHVALIGSVLNAFDLNRTVMVMLFTLTLMAALSVGAVVHHRSFDRKKWFGFGLSAVLSVIFAIILKPEWWVILLTVLTLSVLVFNVKYKIVSKTFLVLVLSVFFVGFGIKAYKEGVRGYWDVRWAAESYGAKYHSLVWGNGYFEAKYRLFKDENGQSRSNILNTIKGDRPANSYRLAEIGMSHYSDIYFMANRIPTIYGALNLYAYRYHMFYRILIDDVRINNPSKFEGFIDWPTQVAGFGSRYNQNLLSLMGVKWLIAPANLAENRFPIKVKGKNYILYENRNVFPLVFPVSGIRVVQKTNDILDYLKNASVGDLKECIPVLKEDLPGYPLPVTNCNHPGENQVRIRDIQANEVTAEVSSEKGCFLVFTANFHMNWRVLIDGVPTGKDIFPAYYTFIGTYVPKGIHVVKFEFQDRMHVFVLLNKILAAFRKK